MMFLLSTLSKNVFERRSSEVLPSDVLKVRTIQKDMLHFHSGVAGHTHTWVGLLQITDRNVLRARVASFQSVQNYSATTCEEFTRMRCANSWVNGVMFIVCSTIADILQDRV